MDIGNLPKEISQIIFRFVPHDWCCTGRYSVKKKKKKQQNKTKKKVVEIDFGFDDMEFELSESAKKTAEDAFNNYVYKNS